MSKKLPSSSDAPSILPSWAEQMVGTAETHWSDSCPTAQVAGGKPGSTDHLLLVAEISALLRCSEATVRKYLREGELIGHRVVGGHWRVYQTDLGKFISAKPAAAARHIPCLDQTPADRSTTASVEPVQPPSISLDSTKTKPKGVAT